MTHALVLVNGLPGSGKTTLAGRLGEVMGAVVISKDAIKEAVADAVGLDGIGGAMWGGASMEMGWALASAVNATAVVESWWFAPRDTEYVRAALDRIRPDRAVEVWCEAGTETARRRYAARRRHPVHRDGDRLRSDWDLWAAAAQPLSLCPVVVVDTSRHVDAIAVVAQIDAATERLP